MNQLAEKYLERKQRELNRRIDHADYADELQRARHRIADRNLFGVDLNPVALELAERSGSAFCYRELESTPAHEQEVFDGSIKQRRAQLFGGLQGLRG